jgi:hypothetical protein
VALALLQRFTEVLKRLDERVRESSIIHRKQGVTCYIHMASDTIQAYAEASVVCAGGGHGGATGRAPQEGGQDQAARKGAELDLSVVDAGGWALRTLVLSFVIRGGG